jgi:hypothetical protein
VKGVVLNAPAARLGSLRREMTRLLEADDFVARFAEWTRYPPRRIVSSLLSFLCSTDETIKWRAVTAVGTVVAAMADDDMEGARTIMRRLIWSLNDESGGIGWGAPEAMGEIMARHGQLADEYYRILLSYVDPDGNRLEHGLLERGALWALGRLARERPRLLEGSIRIILPYLQSEDPIQRGLAAWILGFLIRPPSLEWLDRVLEDHTEIVIYERETLHRYRISELAARLLLPTGRDTGAA